jgi:hypothetical protein
MDAFISYQSQPPRAVSAVSIAKLNRDYVEVAEAVKRALIAESRLSPAPDELAGPSAEQRRFSPRGRPIRHMYLIDETRE